MNPHRPPFRVDRLLHGGDYNPEQWPRATWDHDMALMRKAGVNVATIGVFSWGELEPSEGEFDFTWMDDLFDLLHGNGVRVVLATPSAAQPAWMSKQYPEILRVDPDGTRRRHGNRVNFCWTSPIYRKKVHTIADKLAERYGNHPALLLWHISNEYGGECHCALCRDAFREWLKREFDHDLDRLNAAFWTTFWGHRFRNWDEIEIPAHPHGEMSIHGLTLCWRRFVTDQIVDFYRQESEPARRRSPHVPVTTNLMGFYGGLNPWKLAPYVDVVAWDSYPGFVERPLEPQDWHKVAMIHDLNRSLGGGKPFLLMESTPSSSNWYPKMTIKPPGMHRLESLQAIAHGSEGVMYFQWRQSRGSQEKLHGAVVGHGDAGNSRVFRDVAAVGEELSGLGFLAGSTVDADVALIYDWESAWALDISVGPLQGDKKLHETCQRFTTALARLGVTTDIVSAGTDLSRYKLVIAPMLYSVTPESVQNLERFVEGGGVLLATYLTAYVDGYDLVFENGFLGPLRRLFGVEVEEMDVLHEVEAGSIVAVDPNPLGLSGSYATATFSEIIHAVDATVVATYGSRFYAGAPAVTERQAGQGTAVYVAARTDQRFVDDLVAGLVRRAQVHRLVSEPLPDALRVVRRGDTTFVMNLSTLPQEVQTSIYAGTLEPYGVAVIRTDVAASAVADEPTAAKV